MLNFRGFQNMRIKIKLQLFKKFTAALYKIRSRYFYSFLNRQVGCN